MSNGRVDPDTVLLGMKNSAISVLSRAVEHDNCRRFAQALACYQEGIQIFLDVIKSTENESVCKHLRTKTTEYITRAEKIKEYIKNEKELENYHDQIQIPENATGFSYDSIFKKYLDELVTRIEINDPCIQTIHQVYNFLHFCEVVVKGCPKLQRILLTTSSCDDHANQNSRLQAIKESLKEHGVELCITYSSVLYDRGISFDNGWITNIGRGLDIFKPCNKFALGFCDQSLKRCRETTIDVFYQSK